ncbi:hypothetical protein [Alkaliphilus sp. B6464]|uniref:hypothetical protein n=1 Tax=Alkaliphilus sp. B6464 TaxID=2731219 RepID=UPI001BA4FE97|nr:hypothetical protein [Alkaliphilus sp. B6464]QUH20377.1 hypothetical protein HYG84_11030 [Alkaliphilus sp. B6464]
MIGNILDEKIYEKYDEKLKQVFKFHKIVRVIDNSLEKLYPVAIVEDNNYILFDLDKAKKKYIFIKAHPIKMKVPKGIIAAMDLDFYDYKLAAVISSEVLDDIEGYALLFHEFVHCHQFYKCELELKKGLKIYDEAMKKKDYMWELNHPFPYTDPFFVKYTLEIDKHFKMNEYQKVKEYYFHMKDYLNRIDFEYMIWQQWKEGFARFIENKTRENLKLVTNYQNIKQPFNRVSFYEIGSRYINLIKSNSEEQKYDIEDLFYEMLAR